MNEYEWMTSTDPGAMLRNCKPIGREGNTVDRVRAGEEARWFVRGPDPGATCWITPRQCRAFAVGAITYRGLQAERHWHRLETGKDTNPDTQWRGISDYDWAMSWVGSDRADGAWFKADLLRDVVGNPWGWLLVVGGVPWLTPRVRDLALAAYVNLTPDGWVDPDRLLVLGDALEEAGCVEEPILNHVRGLRPVYMMEHFNSGETLTFVHHWEPSVAKHVRGCWVLDLLLERR